MLTVNELDTLARECYESAGQIPEPTKLEEDARAALQRLVDDRSLRRNHRDAIRLLRRTLAVDVTDTLSRRGPIPKALGLASRVSKVAAVEHAAIVRMMSRLREHSEWDGPDQVQFPYDSNQKAAQAVVVGFYESSINRRLTLENVLKIWARHFASLK